MVDLLTLSLASLQIIIQLGAVYFAYRLTKITGAFRAWLMVIFALVLMTVRRITALMIEIGSLAAFAGATAFIDRIILPLAISVLLLLAMYDLIRTFRRQMQSNRA
ncbi:MAG: hypothetical protein HYU02_04280 [Thaumarchaeota archaeon]|nr:hypothetical protein [Nitrososphaerota archaeon]